MAEEYVSYDKYRADLADFRADMARFREETRTNIQELRIELHKAVSTQTKSQLAPITIGECIPRDAIGSDASAQTGQPMGRVGGRLATGFGSSSSPPCHRFI